MKTTIDISDALLRRAKQAALERNTTLRAIIESALERALGTTPVVMPPLHTLTWPPSDSGAPILEARALKAAIDAERDGHPGDAGRMARRLGYRPPGFAPE